MDRVILFDIDHTLIDTDKLRVAITQSLIDSLETTEENFTEVEQKYIRLLKSSTDFNPEDYIKVVAKSYKIHSKKLKKTFYKKGFFSSSLFPDVIKVLDPLSKKYKLGVFSEGLEEFQNQKLLLANLQKYFDDNYKFIFRRKILKANITTLPVKSIIIDDNKTVAEKLFSEGLFKVFWVNRKNRIPHKKIDTIFSLDDLLKNKLL